MDNPNLEQRLQALLAYELVCVRLGVSKHKPKKVFHYLSKGKIVLILDKKGKKNTKYYSWIKGIMLMILQSIIKYYLPNILSLLDHIFSLF